MFTRADLKSGRIRIRTKLLEKPVVSVHRMFLRPAYVLVLTLLAVGGCAFGTAPLPARIVTQIPWADHGVWLKADFHTHTRFSDGSHTVDEVVSGALKNGCDVVAITDHGDGNLRAGTPDYVEAIRRARAVYPTITVMTALEWNVPPGKGLEHATVLFPSQMETPEVLVPFKERFDDEKKKGENQALAVQGFAALAPEDSSAIAPVVFFNHPSRKPHSPSAPKLTFEALKKLAPTLLIGFEGAPGYQRATPIGDYPADATPIDRWDPLVAEVDGAWDRWLRKGLDVWAATAGSDFHNESSAFWPCEFATTWVYAPDRTVDGVIRAMRAGSFFAEHGHIVSGVELEARFAGQPRAVHAGETVETTVGDNATVSLRMEVPPTDYRGRDNRIDAVELIGISLAKTETLFSGPPEAGEAFRTTVTIPAGGIVLRARGRHVVAGEPALVFYTNPIRVTVR